MEKLKQSLCALAEGLLWAATLGRLPREPASSAADEGPQGPRGVCSGESAGDRPAMPWTSRLYSVPHSRCVVWEGPAALDTMEFNLV